MQTNLRVEKRSFHYEADLIFSSGNSKIAVEGGHFRVRHCAEICQFDRFSLETNFKRARTCNYGIPRLGSSEKKYTSLSFVSVLSPSVRVIAGCFLSRKSASKHGLDTFPYGATRELVCNEQLWARATLRRLRSYNVG